MNEYELEVWNGINQPDRRLGTIMTKNLPAKGETIDITGLGMARQAVVKNIWPTGSHTIHKHRYTVIIN